MKEVQCVLNPKYWLQKIPETVIPGKKKGEPDWLVDWQISKKLSADYARKEGRSHADALSPYGKQTTNSGHKNRWDLKVGMQCGRSKEVTFTRALGFTLLKYKGKALRKSQWKGIFVDHKESTKVWDCRLRNLQLLTHPEHTAKTKLDLRKRPAARANT